MSDFTMPSLGADMENGKLVEWLVKPGDAVHSGDVVAVIETHKGAIEVEVFENGTVADLCAKEGETVPVGGLLAHVRTAGETKATTAASEVLQKPVPAARSSSVGALPAFLRTKHVKVSPAARRLAAELGIDPEGLAGTGVDGSVSLADVELARSGGVKPSPVARSTGFDPTAMRQAIAAAMARSKREIPHYYLSSTIDMDLALRWLSAYNEGKPPTERMLAAVLMLKATALALRQYPQFNGFWHEGGFHAGEGIHVGWAIALRGGGLVAPAVHDADGLALPELMERLRELVPRARSGRLRSSEIMDPTMTVTSLGERGADSVTGVIYPPQVAIVGFGRIGERPWVVEGRVAPRQLVQVSLAADHRASDGHAGGLLLRAIEQLLLEPDKL
jgi:pyruvate dehydrogenase E2 component (dihydrolipoamide acetyltransferase)